ncbi:MAG: VRR-NUC domain-containing protein [Pseudomonadota bacterium]
MPKLEPQVPPPPDYYAANLRTLFAHVRTFYGDLLQAEEAAFIETYGQLSCDAQRLYARLITRKGPWLRCDKLRYGEVGDSDAAVAELATAGLIELNEPAPADALLGLLTQAERAEAFPDLARARRDEWILECLSRHSDLRIRQVLAARYRWLSLAKPERLWTLQLLFFGDGHRDTSAFVLEDLGMVRYEDYELKPQNRQFANRPALERFLRLRHLSALSHRLEEHDGLADWLLSALALPVHNRLEQRQRDRACNRVGHYFERLRQFDGALSAYGRSATHPSRERRARILSRLGNPAAAAALSERMGSSARCAEELDFSQRFRADAGRMQQRSRAAIETTELPLAEAPEARIERHAAGLLAASGGVVFHFENALPLGLAGLLFWDVVYAKLPGVFANRFQAAPLDLFWPDFAESRRDAIEARTELLKAPGAVRAALQETCQRKSGAANRLVSWRHLTPETLNLLLEGIPEYALLALARHVISAPYRTRRGFPDLTVIYGPGSFEFVEVKGPTDQLQPGQRIWFETLEHLELPARVLKFRACS